jgi:Zn-dependent protease
MDVFGSGIPIGRYFGIPVRLHFTFVIYAVFRLMETQHLWLGLAFLAGLYFCVLLHEFGHALAARWCDGEATDILLWPLGGLAFCRPAWHPMAHLITSAAGPLVTFALTVLFMGAMWLISLVNWPWTGMTYLYWFAKQMAWLNGFLLVFNLIPAFPMDGGRILRDLLWFWLGAEDATTIAVAVSRILAVIGGVWGIYTSQYMLVMVALFVFMSSGHERQVLATESSGVYGFSIRERLRRGSRRRRFSQGVASLREEASAAFHRCAICGKTEHDDPDLVFRVCTDCSGGQEYCQEHLESHTHV